MSAQRSTPGPGTTVPPVPTACADEPGSPVGGSPWDLNSWVLLSEPGASAGASDSDSRTGAQAPRRARRRSTAGPADPVRELMHRHRGLCERAVDPLEIAAGLEAYGVTDRTAARFRHRDVFSLAEELFARVPREESKCAETTARPESSAPRPAGRGWARFSRAVAIALLTLLPGILTALALALFVRTHVRWEGTPLTTAFVVAVAAAVGATVRLVVHRVLHASPTLLTTLAAYWLTGCALFADQMGGRQSGTGPPPAWADVTVALSLACALAPAVWCARWFAVRARRRLAGSRSLDEFAAGMRPLLTAAVALFVLALLGLQFAVGEMAGLLVARWDGGSGLFTSGLLSATTVLGVLLFTALLLTAHGFRKAASVGLSAACSLQALALLLGDASSVGSGQLPALACGCAALGLLACAYRVLTGASAHRHEAGETCEVREVREHASDTAPRARR